PRLVRPSRLSARASRDGGGYLAASAARPNRAESKGTPMADCKYTPDGTDTDGTDYFHCLTHDRLEPSPDAHCGGNDDSPAHVAQLWTWDRDYSRAWAPTMDPRILAVIERDTDPYAPDGDAYAPAYFRGDYGRLSPAGDTYRDAEADEVAEAWHRARDYYV